MPAAGKVPRPRIEAQMGFDLLMELYDKAKGLDTNSKIKAITKFLAVLQPGIEKKIQWSWMVKGEQANQIVDALRGGLHQLRDGKTFYRRAGGNFLTGVSEPKTVPDGIAWDQPQGRVVRRGSADARNLFISRVFDLLTEVAPWLRVCAREGCGRFFLFQRPKQIYCSEQCAQRVRMTRFLAQRKSAS